MDLTGLKRLLVNAFNAAELRQFVRLGPDGERVEAALPTVGSRDDLAYEAALAWSRHGLLELLRDHLLTERPHRKAEVLALWGEHEVIEPTGPRPDGIHVTIELTPTPSILKPDEIRHLCEHVRRLAEETAPGANVDIRMVELEEQIGGVLTTVEVAIFGDFKDIMVCRTQIDRFHDKPWASPTASTISIEHDDQLLRFTAWAVVSARHLSS